MNMKLISSQNSSARLVPQAHNPLSKPNMCRDDDSDGDFASDTDEGCVHAQPKG